MKTLLLPVTLMIIVSSCNNSKKNKETVSNETSSTAPVSNTTENAGSTSTSGVGNVTYSIADTARTLDGSVLVQADKKKLSPGNDLMAIITATNSSGESITVNILFGLKPGVYPVVGLGLSKGEEVYGGILGGEPAITEYKVNLTECTDLGSNNLGGHKWKISGSIAQEIKIDAMAIMKMSPGHPDAIKVSKYQFSNLTFDDNWEQILEQGLKTLKNQQ